MAMQLKKVLEELKETQRELANWLRISPSAVSQIINHELWPLQTAPEELKGRIREFLKEKNAPASAIAGAFKMAAEAAVSTTTEDYLMLLRKQALNPDTKKHFGLFRDPFQDPEDQSGVYSSKDIRYAREALYTTAKHGGFLALVGESGSGKTTLRRDLYERLRVQQDPVILIEPYVLGMEENDRKGATLKAGSIADAIIATVAPTETIRRSQDAKYRQLHRVLRDSRRSGNRHCLIIEEAHGLPISTLKHLKRFHELEDGFQKLLAIVLIGQPELSVRLSESNPEVREVVQRCEVATLSPLSDVQGFLSHRFEAMGLKLDALMEPTAVEEVVQRLTPTIQRGRVAQRVSLCFPLAVQNLVTGALNLAADLGAPRITADLIKQV
jgi:type II secretory pathway predicted ATPase ExeA